MRLKSLSTAVLTVSLLALPVFSGCSSVSENAAGQCAECQTLRGTGLQVSSYRFEGKAGVRKTGPDGGSASFRRGSFSFRGVHFTGKSFEISAGTGGTFVRDTDGTVKEFDSEEALEKRFGVPLKKLSSWAMGNGEGADARYDGWRSSQVAQIRRMAGRVRVVREFRGAGSPEGDYPEGGRLLREGHDLQCVIRP